MDLKKLRLSVGFKLSSPERGRTEADELHEFVKQITPINF
jgi:hypothetical protein